LGMVPFLSNTSCLYSAYVRGNAELAAGDGDAAAGEFQRILDRTGVVWSCSTGAMAKLGLARAYALKADRQKAAAAYRDFLAAWKDADADVPILERAKAESTKLQ